MQQSEAADYPCSLLTVLHQHPNMHSSLPAQLSQLVIAALYDLKQAQRLNAPCDCSECAMWMASAEQQLNEPNERARSAVGLALCRICACLHDGWCGLTGKAPWCDELYSEIPLEAFKKGAVVATAAPTLSVSWHLLLLHQHCSSSWLQLLLFECCCDCCFMVMFLSSILIDCCCNRCYAATWMKLYLLLSAMAIIVYFEADVD